MKTGCLDALSHESLWPFRCQLLFAQQGTCAWSKSGLKITCIVNFLVCLKPIRVLVPFVLITMGECSSQTGHKDPTSFARLQEKHWHCSAQGPRKLTHQKCIYKNQETPFLWIIPRMRTNAERHVNEDVTKNLASVSERIKSGRRTFANFSATVSTQTLFIAASSAIQRALLQASAACEQSRVCNDAQVTGRFGGRPAARHVWHWVLYNIYTTSVPVVRTTRHSVRVATIYFGSGQCTYRTQPWDLRDE